MKKISVYIVPFLFLFASILACQSDDLSAPEQEVPVEEEEQPEEEEEQPEEEPEEVIPGIGAARDISSFDLVAEMGVGWNLGNSLDVTSADKTYWGNPLPSKPIIDAIRDIGFKTLRIPITWGFDQSDVAPYTIDADYLDLVKDVVDYGFQNQMHVIINVHHDNEWVVPHVDHAQESQARLSSLWTQVAEHFKEYNDSLIFETLNEPRLEGIPEEWNGGTSAGRFYVNEFNKAAVNAIRATGGNNSLRHIMIPTWAASTVPAAMDDLIIPNNDPKVIVSLHAYYPWGFAGQATQSWGSQQDKANLRGELDRIRQKWIVDQQRAVILGEWGSIEDNDINERLDYAEFYVKEAKQRGMLTVVWDDGGMFGLYDRHGLSWEYHNIASAIILAGL